MLKVSQICPVIIKAIYYETIYWNFNFLGSVIFFISAVSKTIIIKVLKSSNNRGRFMANYTLEFSMIPGV